MLVAQLRMPESPWHTATPQARLRETARDERHHGDVNSEIRPNCMKFHHALFPGSLTCMMDF